MFPNFSQYIAELPAIGSLFREVNGDLGSNGTWFILVLTCFMLTIHGVAVLAIAGAFHWIDEKLETRRIYGANFLSYFIAILLIIASHFAEIIAWTYVCIVLKVLPTNPQILYFVGEMYTTIGYGTYMLADQWKILPVIIAFSGIFAASMSGAALYTMIGALLNHKNKDKITN
jgi:hypothetical protein